jgi:Fe/S biogenesis protein NfuA
MSLDPQNTEASIQITEAARAAVLQARAGQPEADNLALWLEVAGVEDGQWAYDMYLMHVDEASASDVVQRHDDLSIVIPADSVDKVRGALIDLSADPSFKTWTLMNPNTPPAQPSGPIIDPSSLMRRPPTPGEAPSSPPMKPPPANLSGDVPQKVMQVLQYQINPSIASHGGNAELVAVEDGVAYLRLGGGCQGCAMASVTLTQGIRVAITDAVPEITEVVDVTDHASGANPYFETSKK